MEEYFESASVIQLRSSIFRFTTEQPITLTENSNEDKTQHFQRELLIPLKVIMRQIPFKNQEGKYYM